MEEDERVQAEAASANVVRGGCHVASDGTPLPQQGAVSPGAAAATAGGRLGPDGALARGRNGRAGHVRGVAPARARGAALAADARAFVPHDVGCGLLPRHRALRLRPGLRAAGLGLPAGVLPAAAAGGAGRRDRGDLGALGRRGAGRARQPRGAWCCCTASAASCATAARALLACAAVSFFPFAYVLSTNYSEGLFLLASLGAFAAARSRHPVLAFAAGFAAGLARPAAIPLALGLGADAVLAPERRRASLAGAAGAVAGVAVVFADLERRRDDWLASLHAQQLGWQRSTSLVDAPGELAALRPGCDHARALPEPALPHGRPAGRRSRSSCCGATASATACSCTP